MSIRGTFVGINRYKDPEILDLGGACNDATAFWALFSDTFTGSEHTLLLDAEATSDAVLAALSGTMEAAGPDDIVIFTFSGHGTRDGHLATYDAQVLDLDETTIAMDQIAERFRTCKAKVLLIVIDCCFSGRTGTRVIEQSPASRGLTNSVKTLEGEGRIIITAAAADQEAWEAPGSSHGLLSKALLDVLQRREAASDLMKAVVEAAEITYAEAQRMGYEQTPTILGATTGNVTIPPLVRGDAFYRSFPQAKGAKVSSVIDDLAVFGFSPAVLTEWSVRYKKGLNKLQLQAVNDSRILDGESLLVIAPTSSGKTFIGELAAAKAITEGRKAVFLLPYRALTNEKYDQFRDLYGRELGMRVIQCTGDYLDQTADFVRGKYDLALLTYEMFLNLISGSPHILHRLGLVVLDEAQFIGDPHRGIVVELLLTQLLAARERGISPQLIALSAVIGHVNHFDDWLHLKTLISNERPVRLIEGVLDRRGIYQYVDDEGEVRKEQLLPSSAIRQRKTKPGSQDVIVPLTKQLVDAGEKVMVFRNVRGSTQGCANYLADDLSLPAASEALEQLPTRGLSNASQALRACLQGGTAFHNTNLTREERVVVENAFRADDDQVQVLVATSTVAAGINTPANTVIIVEHEFKGATSEAYSVAFYKNMAGRAGRLGYQDIGHSILLAETPVEAQRLFQRYVMGKPEPMRSSFSPQSIDTWVLRLLAQIPRVQREQLVSLLANTYGGYQHHLQNPEWGVRLRPQLVDLVQRMLTYELLEEDGEFIQLSMLGRACGRAGWPFASIMRFLEMLKVLPAGEASPLGLMALLQGLPELDGVYIPLVNGAGESIRANEAVARFGPEWIMPLKRRVENELQYYRRCKRAAILYDWITGVPIDVLEERYTKNAFNRVEYSHVRSVATQTRFTLRAASEIVAAASVPLEADAVETLVKQLEVGIPAHAVGLLSLPFQLPRVAYLDLIARGIVTREQLFELPVNELEALIGADFAQQVRASASE